jgi:hypothetical protein
VSLIFVTTCGVSYPKAFIFPTLRHIDMTLWTIALLDPADRRELPHKVDRLPYVGDRFYQDGKFLDALPLLDANDVAILADADAVIQRDLNDNERLMLDNLGDGIAAGWNMKPGQMGKDELGILRLAGGLSPDMGECFDRQLEHAAVMLRLTSSDMLACPMYNWGLVAAKVSTWRRLRALYAQHTAGLDPQILFEHPTWLQYALCCIVYKHGIPLVPMDYSLHSHQHFPMQPEHHVWERKLFYKNELVFFAHLVGGVTH